MAYYKLGALSHLTTWYFILFRKSLSYLCRSKVDKVEKVDKVDKVDKVEKVENELRVS